MTYQQALEKLRSLGQEHLLGDWDTLTSTEQQHLLSQIEALDLPQLLEQRSLLAHPARDSSIIHPFTNAFPKGNAEDREAGMRAISSGQVGCIILAGGMGTRLGWNGPKGTFPTSLIRKASLFQLFAEKTKAASKQAGNNLPLAIMTSPLNHKTTTDFFNKNNLFGLSQQQLTFFEQKMIPFLDQNENLFLEKKGSIAQGPSGNAFACKGLTSSGLGNKWKAQGIRSVIVIQIDNPLADPFDAELIGFHLRQKAEISLKCTTRRDADEKVGVLAERNGKSCVVEYFDLPEPMRSARNANGELIYHCANLSIFCFSIDFLLAGANIPLPLHSTLKPAKSIENPNQLSWKFEYFLFDLLPYAKKVSVLLAPRATCFAPLKNREGLDSIETVQSALKKRDHDRIQEVTGHAVPDIPLELAQDFYYPTPELLKSWRGKLIPPYASFIE